MLEKYIISPESDVKSAIENMECGRRPVVFIVDNKGILLGIFTLGDMRKFILHNGNLSTNITKVMNSSPVVCTSLNEAKELKKKKKMVVYPIIDEEGKLVDAIFERDNVNDRISNELVNVPLVIMAGGKGTRLYPYTRVLPKALIPIGDFTIAERIVNEFCRYGCKEVYFILNHKANMIKAFFNDLDKGYNVHFIEEKEFLGTGGGLQLLKGIINETFILSNCDILVRDDLECILRTHKLRKNKITCVCASKRISIPYGVIEADENGKILNIKEKPEYSALVNTGMYVIEPDIIDSIKENEFLNLPDIVKRYVDEGKNVGVFPVPEKSWLDMGQLEEMENMIKELENGGN